MRRFKVTKDETGLRADRFVAGRFSQYARSALGKLFNLGLVTRSGQPLKAGSRLKTGQTVNVDERLLSARPLAISLPVVYEDDDVVVINKPAGVLTHSKGALSSEPSVASFIKDKVAADWRPGNRTGIVHRLDRATSGLIVCAKHAAAQQWLQRQFATRKVKKTYLALIDGQPKQAQALIDMPIERNPKRPQTFRTGAKGKPAQTSYKLLRRLGQYSELELKPFTGRTHQLRVHLKALGHPILGDKLYGRQDGIANLKLHAGGLELVLPSKRRRAFSVPPPDDFYMEVGK